MLTISPKILIYTILLSLSACSYSPPSSESSPYFRIPAGSTLTSKRDIVVPPDRFDAYLDYAENRPDTVSRDEESTYCKLEMHRAHPISRTIKPTKFHVTQVAYGVDYTLRRPAKVAYSLQRTDLPTTESHATTLFLHSEQYPGVRSILCEFDADFGMGFPLPLTTIRWALGGHFDLLLAR